MLQRETKSNLSPFPADVYQGAQTQLGRPECGSRSYRGWRLLEVDVGTSSASDCMVVVGWPHKAEGAELQWQAEYKTACKEQENHKT